MLFWLLVPVARCSYHAFRDTPLGEVDPDNAPNDADADRLKEGKGFVGKVLSSTKKCYAETPLFGQERWKSTLMVLFADSRCRRISSTGSRRAASVRSPSDGADPRDHGRHAHCTISLHEPHR